MVDVHTKHITEFDKSDSIIPHGEVSRQLYENIFGKRKFNLYGGRYQRENLTDIEEQEISNVARRLGMGHSSQVSAAQEEAKGVIRHIDIFGSKGLEEMKRPTLTTAAHNLQLAESYHAPVGFANNPARTIKSEGNEKYYSYDGSWEKGKMHGYGHYLYEDGGRYVGEFRDNWPHGEGSKAYKSHVIDKYAHKHPKENVQLLRDVFNLFDLNENGYIGIKEFALCMGVLNPKLSNDEVMKKAKEEVHNADINQDGKIDFREFLVQAPVTHDVSLIHESIKVLNGYLESLPEKVQEELRNADDDVVEEKEEEIELAKDTHSYRGFWSRGRFEGRGVQTTKSGHFYEGDFVFGRREGVGKIQYKSGMVYEGEMKNGKPHGRGRMESKLSGYIYEGDFVNGSIEGSGTIITPPPECRRVVRYNLVF